MLVRLGWAPDISIKTATRSVLPIFWHMRTRSRLHCFTCLGKPQTQMAPKQGRAGQCRQMRHWHPGFLDIVNLRHAPIGRQLISLSSQRLENSLRCSKDMARYSRGKALWPRAASVLPSTCPVVPALCKGAISLLP